MIRTVLSLTIKEEGGRRKKKAQMFQTSKITFKSLKDEACQKAECYVNMKQNIAPEVFILRFSCTMKIDLENMGTHHAGFFSYYILISIEIKKRKNNVPRHFFPV